MQDTTASVNYRRKKRRRKILIRRIILSALAVIAIAAVTVCAIYIDGILNPENHSNENVKNAMDVEVPDWVDVQIIHKHGSARTGRKLQDVKNVVIHYVGNPGTTAQNNRDYFNKADTDVSAHFVVGLEGEIIQCIPLYERSAASNHRNRDTISIEVCHPDESGRFNKETYDSVIKLTAWLLNEFSLDENDILRHYDITEKICPKYYVENEDEWDNLKKDVKEELDEY